MNIHLTGRGFVPHKNFHDPEDGADALDTAAPLELASVQTSGIGTSHSFARADHAHQIQHSIADNHLVTIDGTTNQPVDDDYAKFTASGLEGRSYAQVLSDIGAAASAHTHDDRYYTETEIGIWRNSVTQTEMGYLNGLTSDLQTQLDARALESVVGTSIGTGLLLDGTVLKASSVLQTYHGIDPSADVQSVLGCANEAAIRTFLDLEAGVDFPSLATFETHHDRHDPEDGADALDCAAPPEVSVVVAAGEGSAHSFARSDHVHAITHAITDNHIVTIDGTANQNEHAVFGAGGIAGLTDAELLAALSGDAGAAFSWNNQNLTSVGNITVGSNKWIGLGAASERIQFDVGSELAPTSCCTDPDDDQNVTTGWTANNANLTSEAGGVTGQRLKVNTTAAWGSAQKLSISLIKGKSYRLKAKAGADIGDNYILLLSSLIYGTAYTTGIVAGAGAGTWDTIDKIIECPSTQTDWRIILQGVGNGDNIYFDNVSLEQIDIISVMGGDVSIGEGDLFLANGNYIGIPEAERLEFYSAGYAAFMGCKVGIGTASPDYKLHVSGAATPELVVEDTTNNRKAFMSASDSAAFFGELSGTGYVEIRAGGATRLLIRDNGNIGIGKTPSSKLDIDFATEDLELVDAGSVGATEQDWIEVEVGGNTGYIKVFAAK